MDAGHARLMREFLAGTAWVDRTRAFARALRDADHYPGGLLIVGTPASEPWHLTAHLTDEARLARLPELSPTLVRHRVPGSAAPHLAIGLGRLEAAKRGETVFVVAPGQAPGGLLSRLDDARRAGATVLAMEAGDRDLRGLAHETLTVASQPAGSADPRSLPQAASALWRAAPLVADGIIVPDDLEAAFETAQHLVSLAAGETPVTVGTRKGFRDRLGSFLDAVTGPDPASP